MYKMFSKKSTEDTGIFIEIDMGFDEPSWRFRVGFLNQNNKAYTKCVRKLTKPYDAMRRFNQMPEGLEEKLTMMAFCESILLDWENVTKEDGTSLEFNIDNAMGLFKQLPHLYDQLLKDCQDRSLFEEEELKASAKN